YRETAALAAEGERVASEAARAATIEARATAAAARRAARKAAAARRAARKAARRAAREQARKRKQGRPGGSGPAPQLAEHSTADRGVRIFGGLLAALVLVFALIGMIGERYGTRARVPGHQRHDHHLPHGRYQVICF